MSEQPHLDEPVVLSGRRKALLALDERIPSMAEQTRTQMYGVADKKRIWQPADFLPDFAKQKVAFEQVRDIQAQARDLPPELLMVLVGDTVTEEGLPEFSSRLFSMHGLPYNDEGDAHAQPGNLQRWFREWVGEENRHGDLLNSYLAYSGRIDMRAFQETVQLFLSDGMDIDIGGDPYRCFVYTSFQELATQRSHTNVAKLAGRYGNRLLSTICGKISADEALHARSYSAFVRIFFEMDPDGMMEAMNDMYERGIVMPAHNMREIDPSGNMLRPGETYEKFSNVAQQLGVYTTRDYAEISASLIEEWGVGRKSEGRWEPLQIHSFTERGKDAQHQILRRQRVIEKMADRDRKKSLPALDTSWLVDGR